MNFGNLPKVSALNELRIVIIFIVFRSFLDVSPNREVGKHLKHDVNLRIRIMCALHFKHGFKPTDGGHSPTEGTQDCTQLQV